MARDIVYTNFTSNQPKKCESTNKINKKNSQINFAFKLLTFPFSFKCCQFGEFGVYSFRFCMVFVWSCCLAFFFFSSVFFVSFVSHFFSLLRCSINDIACVLFTCISPLIFVFALFLCIHFALSPFAHIYTFQCTHSTFA